MPATDYLMPDGLEWDELAELLAPLGASPGLAGLSLGCLNPEKDPGGDLHRADLRAAGRRAAPRAESDLEARVLEVEVALDAAHDLVVDLAHVAQADDLGALGLEHLAPQALVGLGPPSIAPSSSSSKRAEKRRMRKSYMPRMRSAVSSRTQSCSRSSSMPVERGARGQDARLGLALLEVAVVLDAEHAG